MHTEALSKHKMNIGENSLYCGFMNSIMHIKNTLQVSVQSFELLPALMYAPKARYGKELKQNRF